MRTGVRPAPRAPGTRSSGACPAGRGQRWRTVLAVFFWRHDVAPGRSSGAGLVCGFTSRAGGVSLPPYESLNLGGHVGDSARSVEHNRAALAGAVGLERDRLIFLNQAHGDRVVSVDGPWPGPAPEADAVVTSNHRLGLAVLVADCVPVLLADTRSGVIGAVHAGRAGLVLGVVGRAVERMREIGASSISAVVGPSVCGRCYEVPERMRDEAAVVSPVSRTVSWSGTPAIDIAAGVVDQLHANHVPVQWVPGCTRESPELFSHRESPGTGRFAGVVRLTGPCG